MKRLAPAALLLLCGGAVAAAWREPQGEPKLAAGEKPPQVMYGRRSIPSDADPYVLRDLDLDALHVRLEAAGGTPSDAEARAAAYTLLLWHLHSILSVDDDVTRSDLYRRAESLYAALLSDSARSGERDRRLESNAAFLIGAAWVAWKGTTDGLTRERLERSAALKEGQYRTAAELLAEKTPYRPGLDVAVAKLLEGDAAAALSLIDDALKKTPAEATALHWRGIALLMLDRPADAIVPLNAFLAVQPRDAAAREARGSAHYALRHWAKALEDWEAAIDADASARGRLQPFIEAARKAAR